MSINLLEKIDLDDVLAKFSIRGRYHVVNGLWLILGLAFNTLCYCSYVFIAEEIKYSCANDTLSLRYINKTLNWTYQVQNITSSTCSDPNPCQQWIYENPHSFVAEFQLACQEWKRTLVGPAHIFGYSVGVTLIGSFTDRFGRKPLAVITGITGAVCGLAKSFATYYWIYIAFEFLEASLGDPYLPLYTLGLEMVATKSRATYMTTCSLGLVIGGMSFPLIKWLVPYWRTCLRVMYTPGLLFILLIYLIDESPRWLLTKGKINIAVQNIENAAKIDKLEIEENLNMISYEQDVSANFTTVIADTFRSRSLLKRFFVCVVWWYTCIFVSHGLTITSVLLEGNKYVNFALVFLMRLPSSILAACVLNKFNRKGPLMSCFIACGLMCITHPFIPKDVLWLVITMFMTSKLMTGLSFTILYIFTSELFPTYTRNSMQALCSALGRVGGIIATQMPLLRAYWTGLPIVLFGVTSLVAAFATLLVPDTGKACLPDTVRQAESLDATESRTSQKKYNDSSCSRKNRTDFNE
ncbi:solute carrier family 22 member 1-like isoform X2 [Choristoneura fumiferana]|uniref:solute carrier family 22 member 1-like isoform X2 n=1 Tax=Choristoneura fumiferana TaxID=7141 RepID=UPI003D159C34